MVGSAVADGDAAADWLDDGPGEAEPAALGSAAGVGDVGDAGGVGLPDALAASVGAGDGGALGPGALESVVSRTINAVTSPAIAVMTPMTLAQKADLFSLIFRFPVLQSWPLRSRHCRQAPLAR